MNLTVRLLGTTLLGTCLLAAPVLADVGGDVDDARSVYSAHDHDRDGYLDRREYYRLRKRLHAKRGPLAGSIPMSEFSELDKDGDGRVSRRELLEHLGRGRGRGRR